MFNLDCDWLTCAARWGVIVPWLSTMVEGWRDVMALLDHVVPGWCLHDHHKGYVHINRIENTNYFNVFIAHDRWTTSFYCISGPHQGRPWTFPNIFIEIARTDLYSFRPAGTGQNWQPMGYSLRTRPSVYFASGV